MRIKNSVSIWNTVSRIFFVWYRYSLIKLHQCCILMIIFLLTVLVGICTLWVTIPKHSASFNGTVGCDQENDSSSYQRDYPGYIICWSVQEISYNILFFLFTFIIYLFIITSFIYCFTQEIPSQKITHQPLIYVALTI